ncbi:hypothetical protein L207DRAFT_505419 [Hyaloscypha variabilis F]|uniref:Uncharacterized protein n=1 Tax=Hyaloscypha variabilis (strain UAMH 11265 / GT02V1 / F) TaxID=1149755 RepID=A0A2J6SC94_HYAVF|nr:hypothetical protein L207DRAFT_505419 [Hyaloscypha variabilis F]
MQFPNLKTKAQVLGVDQFKQKSSQVRIQLMDDFIISRTDIYGVYVYNVVLVIRWNRTQNKKLPIKTKI